MTTRRLFVASFVIALFALSVRNITDPDFGWHWRTGELIATTGSIPQTDSLSYTAASQPRVVHEWLLDLVIYLLSRAGGDTALILFFGLLAALTFSLLYLACEGRPYVAAFVVLLAALASAPFWGVRSQTVALLFTSAFIYLLTRFRREGFGRMHLLFVPLMLLWANLHGSFVIGLLLIGAYAVGTGLEREFAGERNYPDGWRDPRALGGVLLLCLLVIAINPSGLAIYPYPFQTFDSGIMQAYIQEWHSPDFHDFALQPLLLVLALTLIALGLAKRRPGLVELALLIVLTFAGLRSARLFSIWALVAAPMVSASLVQILSGLPPKMPAMPSGQPRRLLWLNWVVLILLAFAAGARVAAVIADQPRAEAEAWPVAAVDYIQAHDLSGPMLNAYDWGGYLALRLYPQERVFIDGRMDLYALNGDKIVRDYVQLYDGASGWRSALDHYQLRLVLLPPDAPLVNLLAEESGWDEEYRDKQAVLLARR